VKSAEIFRNLAPWQVTQLSRHPARPHTLRLNKRVYEALILSGTLDGLAKNRASLMAQLPEAIRAAEQSARDAEAGQFDIFGATPAAAASAAAPAAIEVDEWPVAQRLAGERDTLGHYLVVPEELI